MGRFNLKKYIHDQQSRGYSESQIKEFLKKYGYTPEQIKKAIEKHGFFNNFRKKPVNQKLRTTVQTYLTRGYTKDAIRGSLENYYSSSDIENAIDSLSPHQIRHVFDVSNKVFILLAIISIIIAASIFFIIKSDAPPKLMDYRLELEGTKIIPGEKLEFKNIFVNMGSKRKYDIQIDYKVTNYRSGEVLIAKGETIEVSSVVTSERNFIIPDDAEYGKYKIEGILRYGDDIATSYELFDITESIDDPTIPLPAESCIDGIQNQDETGIDCGGICNPCAIQKPSCYDGIKNQNEENIDCGGVCNTCNNPITVPDNEEILAKVKALGNINEDESKRLCTEVDDTKLKDDCRLELAQIFEKNEYCDDITREALGNVCYMHFVQLGDYSVCEKITDVYIRKSCESLKQIQVIMGNQTTS